MLRQTIEFAALTMPLGLHIKLIIASRFGMVRHPVASVQALAVGKQQARRSLPRAIAPFARVTGGRGFIVNRQAGRHIAFKTWYWYFVTFQAMPGYGPSVRRSCRFPGGRFRRQPGHAHRESA